MLTYRIRLVNPAERTVLQQRRYNRDTIYDFEAGIDNIDLSAIDANTGLDGDQAFTWGGSRAVANGAWSVWTLTGTVVRVDVNGDCVADMEIGVSGLANLGARDFFL